jgi:hypothetical protein
VQVAALVLLLDTLYPVLQAVMFTAHPVAEVDAPVRDHVAALLGELVHAVQPAVLVVIFLPCELP